MGGLFRKLLGETAKFAKMGIEIVAFLFHFVPSIAVQNPHIQDVRAEIKRGNKIRRNETSAEATQKIRGFQQRLTKSISFLIPQIVRLAIQTSLLQPGHPFRAHNQEDEELRELVNSPAPHCD